MELGQDGTRAQLPGWLVEGIVGRLAIPPALDVFYGRAGSAAPAGVPSSPQQERLAPGILTVSGGGPAAPQRNAAQLASDIEAVPGRPSCERGSYVLFGDDLGAAALTDGEVPGLALPAGVEAVGQERGVPQRARYARIFLGIDADMISASTEYSAVVHVLVSAARVLLEHPDWLAAAVLPDLGDLDKAEIHDGFTDARQASVSKNAELLYKLPILIDWLGFRPASSTVHKRPELMGALSASSLRHPTVNEFHAHGGTAITLNLRQTRLARASTDVCVVGGRPFALALAVRGDNVVVLERGTGFERSVRDESLSLDTVWRPKRSGVLDQLCEQRIAEVTGTELVPDGEMLMWVNFADYDSVRLHIEVPQPMLVRTLADAAAVSLHFMLVRSAGATDLLRSGGKVTGVSARVPDGEFEARLTVGADGRYSNVLGRSEVALRKLPMNQGLVRPCPDAWTSDTHRVLDIFTTAVPKWIAPGAAGIRDAAHAMSPELAQGVSQEKMPAPPARAPRRTTHRAVERKPRLKSRVWRDLYHPLPARSGTRRST